MIGLVIAAFGGYLAASPLVVADVLGLPHATPSQAINLRASWGGTVLGIGLFIAWLPAWRPWWRALVGLVMWAMAGIGVARTMGFLLDGSPDNRQIVWITAEVAIVIVGAIILIRRRGTIAAAGR